MVNLGLKISENQTSSRCPRTGLVRISDTYIFFFPFFQNIDNYNDNSPNEKFSWSEATSYGSSDNVMDRWIISFTQSLLLIVKREMSAYRLYTVLPKSVYVHHFTSHYKIQSTSENQTSEIRIMP